MYGNLRMKRRRGRLGQPPLYEFFRCTSAEKQIPLKDLRVQPKRVTFTKNDEVSMIPQKEEEEEPLPRRVTTTEGNAIKVPVGGSVMLDFEVTTPERVKEFDESGGAVEWLLDAHYPPDPEWRYSGKETENEIERFCGALMSLGVVEPTSDIRDADDGDEFVNLESIDLRMICWNINGLQNILKKGGDLKGVFQKWQFDVICLQEL